MSPDTSLGVRIAWTLLCFFAMLIGAFVLLSAIGEPHPPQIGGAVLMTLAVVLLLLPSVRGYETKRIRAVIE